MINILLLLMECKKEKHCIIISMERRKDKHNIICVERAKNKKNIIICVETRRDKELMQEILADSCTVGRNIKRWIRYERCMRENRQVGEHNNDNYFFANFAGIYL